MACWKITTGQPATGFTWPLPAFGTVTKSGIGKFSAFATGTGLKRVRFVEGTPGPPGAASHVPVSGAAGSR